MRFLYFFYTQIVFRSISFSVVMTMSRKWDCCISSLFVSYPDDWSAHCGFWTVKLVNWVFAIRNLSQNLTLKASVEKPIIICLKWTNKVVLHHWNILFKALVRDCSHLATTFMSIKVGSIGNNDNAIFFSLLSSMNISMQPISDDTRSPSHCHQVWTDPKSIQAIILCAVTKCTF